jgi:3-methyladenine DNA glycosylase AlkC
MNDYVVYRGTDYLNQDEVEKIIEDYTNAIELAYEKGEILQQLADNENKWARIIVAQNLYTPINILQQLAKDEHRWVREEVASNSNTSSLILNQLSNDEDWQVRQKIIHNPNLSLETSALQTYLWEPQA